MDGEIAKRHMQRMEEGEAIFSEGEDATNMYIIMDGEVEITKQTSSNSAKVLIALKKR